MRNEPTMPRGPVQARPVGRLPSPAEGHLSPMDTLRNWAMAGPTKKPASGPTDAARKTPRELARRQRQQEERHNNPQDFEELEAQRAVQTNEGGPPEPA